MFVWMIGLLVGIVATLFVVPMVRDYFKKKKVEQLVMRTGEFGPDHAAKAGTPTMGGVAFIAVVIIGYAIVGYFTNSYGATAWATISGILLYAIVGAIDDSVKIFNSRDEGLRFLPKLSVEIIAAILAVGILYVNNFEFSWPMPFGLDPIQSVALYTILVIVWLVGWSNATNLTDGLDGLATGASIIAYLAYLIIAMQAGNTSMMLLDALMVGALLGFFMYNHYPASIFMGDTGSLALGAGLALNAIVLHVEWSLLLIGIVFFVDTMSVIIQVGSFKLRGKRVFLMTPIHHGFEKGGLTGNTDKPWNEWQVDAFFWAMGLLGAAAFFLFFYAG